jgi:CRP/FNR family transcriptional regulator
MLITASAGQPLINMGQSIKMVPMVLDGTPKVSRENEEGQELVLYYVKSGEGCAMTFSCGMMSKVSQVKELRKMIYRCSAFIKPVAN